jgi:hypothetical protein
LSLAAVPRPLDQLLRFVSPPNQLSGERPKARRTSGVSR